MAIARRHVTCEQLVVATIDENNARFVVLVGRCFQYQAVALLHIYHGESEHAFFASPKRLSPHCSFYRTVEEFEGTDARGSVSCSLLQDVHLVAEREDRLIFLTVEICEFETNEVFINVTNVRHGILLR